MTGSKPEMQQQTLINVDPPESMITDAIPVDLYASEGSTISSSASVQSEQKAPKPELSPERKKWLCCVWSLTW